MYSDLISIMKKKKLVLNKTNIKVLNPTNLTKIKGGSDFVVERLERVQTAD